MTKIKGKLIASAPTEERIVKLISDYFYGSNIKLEPTDDEGTFNVHNSKGKVNGYVVVLKDGKYKFQAIN